MAAHPIGFLTYGPLAIYCKAGILHEKVRPDGYRYSFVEVENGSQLNFAACLIRRITTHIIPLWDRCDRDGRVFLYSIQQEE